MVHFSVLKQGCLRGLERPNVGCATGVGTFGDQDLGLAVTFARGTRTIASGGIDAASEVHVGRAVTTPVRCLLRDGGSTADLPRRF